MRLVFRMNDPKSVCGGATAATAAATKLRTGSKSTEEPKEVDVNRM